jgi:hypothetical protein
MNPTCRKKFGHPDHEKNRMEKARSNEPKTTKILNGKIGNREIAAVQKLVVWWPMP